jgi:hypothetical protein
VNAVALIAGAALDEPVEAPVELPELELVVVELELELPHPAITIATTASAAIEPSTRSSRLLTAWSGMNLLLVPYPVPQPKNGM